MCDRAEGGGAAAERRARSSLGGAGLPADLSAPHGNGDSALLALRQVMTDSLNGPPSPPTQVEILNLLTGHPNIAGLKASYEDKHAVHFIIEFCKGEELGDGSGRASRQVGAAGRCGCRCRAGESLRQGEGTWETSTKRSPGRPSKRALEYTSSSKSARLSQRSCGRAGGELFERIISKGTFSEAEAARYFRQMVEVGGRVGGGRVGGG